MPDTTYVGEQPDQPTANGLALDDLDPGQRKAFWVIGVACAALLAAGIAYRLFL